MRVEAALRQRRRQRLEVGARLDRHALARLDDALGGGQVEALDRGDQHLARRGVDVDEGSLRQDDDVGLERLHGAGLDAEPGELGAERGMSGGLAGARVPARALAPLALGSGGGSGDASRMPAAIRGGDVGRDADGLAQALQRGQLERIDRRRR